MGPPLSPPTAPWLEGRAEPRPLRGLHPESCEVLSEFVSVEGCGGSCISHYVDNKYPGRAQNGGRWITLAVMTITPGKREPAGSGGSGCVELMREG